MKKMMKILMVLVLLLNIAIIPSFMLVSNADETGKWNYTAEMGKDWIKKGDANVVGVAQKVTGTVITVMRIVATGIAIIMLTYVAIKYMSAAPQEKADFKKSATAYIVGAIVLFGTTGILTMIDKFAQTIK